MRRPVRKSWQRQSVLVVQAWDRLETIRIEHVKVTHTKGAHT